MRLIDTSALALALALAACGGSQPPPEAPTNDTSEGDGSSRGSGISMDADIGGMNMAEVQQTFRENAGKLNACYRAGAGRVPYLAGEVSFVVLVASDGRARAVYANDSTLGDRKTEACMLDVLRAASWPAPVGGKEGVAESSFAFEPGGDERPPVDWAPEQLGEGYDEARAAVSRCKQEAGTGPVKATLYVETDGSPKAVGVSFADEKGEEAASCIVSALEQLKFPSPGSYAAKATVVID